VPYKTSTTNFCGGPDLRTQRDGRLWLIGKSDVRDLASIE